MRNDGKAIKTLIFHDNIIQTALSDNLLTIHRNLHMRMRVCYSLEFSANNKGAQVYCFIKQRAKGSLGFPPIVIHKIIHSCVCLEIVL